MWSSSSIEIGWCGGVTTVMPPVRRATILRNHCRAVLPWASSSRGRGLFFKQLFVYIYIWAFWGGHDRAPIEAKKTWAEFAIQRMWGGIATPVPTGAKKA